MQMVMVYLNTSKCGGGSSFDGAAKKFYTMNTENMKEFDNGNNISPKDYFKTLTYTGNAGTNAITGVGFQLGLLDKQSRTITTY